jgi:uncharacterized damage-inducible protein DinB
MDALEMLKDNLNSTHRAYFNARQGTDEQLHFVPTDGSHSIAWCLWHTARMEDNLVQGTYRGTTTLWNDDWAARTGLPADGLGVGMSDDDAQGLHLKDSDAFFEYIDTVWAATAEFLDGMTADDLDREVGLGERIEKLGNSISLHMVGHFSSHRGEINWLRGTQGMPPVTPAAPAGA